MTEDKNYPVIVSFVDENNERVSGDVAIPWNVEWAVPNYEEELCNQKDAVIATALLELIKDNEHYKAQSLLKRLTAGTVGVVFHIDRTKAWTSPESNFPSISFVSKDSSDT